MASDRIAQAARLFVGARGQALSCHRLTWLPARFTSAALLRISATMAEICAQVLSTLRPMSASSSRPRTAVRWARSPRLMASVPRRSARSDAWKLTCSDSSR